MRETSRCYEQSDADGDGVGDACDKCPIVQNGAQDGADGDSVGNACDDCPDTPNPEQIDSDGDGIGDVCAPEPPPEAPLPVPDCVVAISRIGDEGGRISEWLGAQFEVTVSYEGTTLPDAASDPRVI
jgi:hypothetical protein